MMEHNKDTYQNGQGYDTDLHNVPDNPYTQYYKEYIIDPGVLKDEVPKPKRIASIILCIISNMILFSFVVMWCFMFYGNLNTPAMTAGSSAAFSAVLFLYFMPGFLITSIIAKVLNRKSLWALINLIVIGIIFAAIMVASIFVPSWYSGKRPASDRNASMNKEVSKLLDEYSFDVEDINEDPSDPEHSSYEVWVYVPTDSDEDTIWELDLFLHDLRNLQKKGKYNDPVIVHPCYFDPDDDRKCYFADSYKITRTSTNRECEISLFEDAEDIETGSGHVPSKIGDGDLLIVIR